MNKIKLSLLIFIIILPICFSLLLFEKHRDKNPDKEQERGYESIKIEEFGTVGDGKTDDTEAIQKAVNSLSKYGGTIIFEPDKTYRITDSIKVNSDISFITIGNRKAKIFMDNYENNKPAFDFSGRIISTSTIRTKEAKIRQYSINLKSTNNVKPNSLLLIESDTPWYYEPRTGTENLHKGELHKIRGISNNEVILEDPLRNTYNKTTEKVSVSIIDPINITIKNLSIDRKKTNDRTIGIQLNYCSNCIIDNVTINNSVSIGIHVVSSYRTSIENSYVEGANDKYSGYGIQSYGSAYSMIRDNKVVGSRRGIDVSGLYPDYYSIVEYNTVYGGGKNELGLNYLSEDTQYGIGSHSTANYTTFRNNILGNLNYGINIRSPNVTIENNHFIGYFKGSCIILGTGKNAVIKNNFTIAGKDVPAFAGKFNLPPDIKTFQASTFVYIKSSYTFNDGYINITNNQVKSISGDFVKLLNSSDNKYNTVANLSISKNFVQYNPNKSINKIHFINSTSPIYAKKLLINDNSVVYDKLQAKYSAYNNLIFK